jgi:hypothetical protein
MMLLGILAVVSGCGESDLTGTYALTRINGTAVPTSLSSGAQIPSGALGLNGDKTFVLHLAVCVGWPNTCSSGSMTSQGTWSAFGSSITLHSGSTTFAATYRSGKVTVQWPNDELHFVKE